VAGARAAITGYTLLGPTPPTTPPAGAVADRKMIVVLPIENLGASEDAYFAAGITEEIPSRLAAIEGLGVISRKRALQYAGTGKSIKEIGAERGIGYVLEGTVRWGGGGEGGSRVRITPQLIRVSDDTHLWSQAYDEVIDDIFKVQSEIAGKVIEKTGIALLERHQRALDFRPTENLEAYRAYVRGLEFIRVPDQTQENFQLQVDLFRRAVELDPGFALAHATLARAHAGLYHFGFDRTEERQALARGAVDRAMELQPDLPEAQFALGIYYYWCHKDYALALDAFAVAELGMPSSADLKEFVGYIRRRQGRWAEAAEDLEASFALNPLDPWLAEEIGMTHSFLRNYAEAEHYLDASIALRPDQANSYLDKAELLWRTQGATEAAEIVLAAMHDNETPLAVMHIFLQQIFSGRFTDAREQMERRQGEMFSHYRFTWPKSLFMAQAYELAGETAKARKAYEASRGV
jgi:serine/threonine-protein kinase